MALRFLMLNFSDGAGVATAVTLVVVVPFEILLFGR
jgi:hypothetical protein